jgi:hypothetical protein
MLPFKIFDKKTKTTWLIINYQAGKGSGTFLAAREDDSPQDGELSVLSLEDLVGCRMLEFVAEADGDE